MDKPSRRGILEGVTGFVAGLGVDRLTRPAETVKKNKAPVETPASSDNQRFRANQEKVAYGERRAYSLAYQTRLYDLSREINKPLKLPEISTDHRTIADVYAQYIHAYGLWRDLNGGLDKFYRNAGVDEAMIQGHLEGEQIKPEQIKQRMSELRNWLTGAFKQLIEAVPDPDTADYEHEVSTKYPDIGGAYGPALDKRGVRGLSAGHSEGDFFKIWDPAEVLQQLAFLTKKKNVYDAGGGVGLGQNEIKRALAYSGKLYAHLWKTTPHEHYRQIDRKTDPENPVLVTNTTFEPRQRDIQIFWGMMNLVESQGLKPAEIGLTEREFQLVKAHKCPDGQEIDLKFTKLKNKGKS